MSTIQCSLQQGMHPLRHTLQRALQATQRPINGQTLVCQSNNGSALGNTSRLHALLYRKKATITMRTLSPLLALVYLRSTAHLHTLLHPLWHTLENREKASIAARRLAAGMDTSPVSLRSRAVSQM
jgi:hypothetical protein